MAKTSIELVRLMRQAVKQIAGGAPYQWGHMGSCNCGHLAQAITKRSKGEIHARAMQRHGDWDQQLRDYCPQSGLPLDEVIDEMLALGLTRQDLSNLERLSDPQILRALPPERRFLKHNLRDDVVLYLKTWVDLLEQELLAKVTLPQMATAPQHLVQVEGQ
ncbi:hypothetical protein BH24BAC1_BH24BAC1_11670 [soil metagenome]|jgi:hypothetical protein